MSDQRPTEEIVEDDVVTQQPLSVGVPAQELLAELREAGWHESLVFVDRLVGGVDAEEWEIHFMGGNSITIKCGEFAGVEAGAYFAQRAPTAGEDIICLDDLSKPTPGMMGGHRLGKVVIIGNQIVHDGRRAPALAS